MKIGIKNGTATQYAILKSCIQSLFRLLKKRTITSLLNLEIDILSKLDLLTQTERDYIETDLTANLELKEAQILVQREMQRDERKASASYFTDSKGLKIIDVLLRAYSKLSNNGDYYIYDPFMGSGKMLIQGIRSLGKPAIVKVFGIEQVYLSALVGFTATLAEFNGDLSKINIYHGDAFEIIMKEEKFKQRQVSNETFTKVIVTNPPFTRWSRVRNKKLIEKLIENSNYSKFVTRKDMGLQIYGLFLCDLLLTPNDFLISVLPLSTFYTIGGNAIKQFLKQDYTIHGLIDSEVHPSFSDDSKIKEIILVAKKGRSDKNSVFLRYSGEPKIALKVFSDRKQKGVNHVNLFSLPLYIDRNWSVLFQDPHFHELLSGFLQSSLTRDFFGFWKDIYPQNRIVRGFEMYGPGFFFLPNKSWKVIEDSNTFLKIRNRLNNVKLSIGKDYLIRSFSKPSFYYSQITSTVNIYCLTIPPQKDLPFQLVKYIEWGKASGLVKSAIKAFGKFWYAHIHKALHTKQPFGHLIIGDKVDLAFISRSIIANFSIALTTASKNFYVIKMDLDTSKLLCAWFNSSMFIAMLLLYSRKISATWSRLLIDDYFSLPVLNVNCIQESHKQRIMSVFDTMLKITDLPTIWEQLYSEQRMKLDLSILMALEMVEPEKFIKSLYASLKSYISS